ncbi:amidase [Thozetella sp. PMI_491]|nr:amidase [Thozetella sp. PMI_491]
MSHQGTPVSSASGTLDGRRDQQQCLPPRLRLPHLNGWDLFEVSVAALQQHYLDGHFSAAEYVALCLGYIRVLNPYLEAVIETNPEAAAIAKSLDDERASGKVRGPLHGVPVLVKDNIATADLMQTTAGSWALLGSVVPKDAFVVSKLREAGAVILGHTNMCEWASVRSRLASDGYSARGGQARNPYDLRKSPSGSSAGSAAAVAANLVPLAVGTETDTSIIWPAAFNGIVGIKPTVGLTSRSGVIPISENMDTVGPLGRTVADAVACLDAMVGQDDEDPVTKLAKGPGEPYARHLATAAALRGARFGLPVKRCWERVPPGCKALASQVFDAMKDAGAEIIEVDLPSVEERTNPEGTWDWRQGTPDKSEWTVAKVDTYNGINAYLEKLVESPVRSLEDIVTFNDQNSGTEGGLPGHSPAFPTGQENFVAMVESKGVKDETYHAALAHIRKQTRENGIDGALLYRDPETGAATELDALLFCDRLGIGQQYAAQAGYPIICIPIGLDSSGMPVSLSLQHSAWREGDLVKWSSAVEDLWKSLRGPRTTPTYRNLGAKNVPIENWDLV